MKLPKLGKVHIIIATLVVAAAGAGLFFSGLIGGAPEKVHKVSPTPVALGEPSFVVNLADTNDEKYAKISVALELAPMTPEELALFTGAGGGGHGGGATVPPGATAVSTYPKFRDAVIDVTSRFRAAELQTPEGKRDLKKALLVRFEQIAEQDAAAAGKTPEGEVHNPTHAPFHVMNVYLQELAVQ